LINNINMKISLIAFVIALVICYSLSCIDLLDVKKAAEEASVRSKDLFSDSNRNLLVQVLFASRIGADEEAKESSRLKWLRCSLRKL
jgi:hypothetical protein